LNNDDKICNIDNNIMSNSETKEHRVEHGYTENEAHTESEVHTDNSREQMLRTIRRKKTLKKRISGKMPSKIITFSMMTMLLITVLFIFISNPIISNNKNEILYYYDHNNKLRVENQELLSQIKKDNDAFYGDMLQETLSVEKLTKLAKSSWRYTITVNGQKITKDNANSIDAKSPNIKVELIEEMINENMPEEIAKLGALIYGNKNSFVEDIFKISAENSQYSFETNKDGSKNTATYILEGITAGEIITVHISSELRDNLKLENNFMEIFNSTLD